MKVLILSCGTGEGHNSAGRAIMEAFKETGTECVMRDVLDFKSDKSRRRITRLYSAAISKTPALFGLCYKIGAAYDALRLPSPIYAYNSRYGGALNKYIDENRFNCVICTHLFAMEAMTAVRNNYKNFVSCYGVLTDYTAIPFYKDTALDGYFTPEARTAAQLIKKGISSDKIFSTGIPVSANFSAPFNKEAERAALGIPQNKRVLAVMSGGVGCGKLVKLCARLLKNDDKDRLVIAFSGKNEKLERKLNKKFGGDTRFMCLPFTREAHKYLKCADAVLTKPGGLSSTEIAVLNVPLVHLKAIPGCETANINYFTANGLSLKGNTVRRAVRCADRLLADGNARDSMRERQRALINGNSTRLIAEISLSGVDGACFTTDVYGAVFETDSGLNGDMTACGVHKW